MKYGALTILAGLALAPPLPALASSGDDESLSHLLKRFERLDRNHDGRVTVREVERARGGCFRRSDGNRDSHLDPDEFADMLHDISRPVADRRFATIDANDDRRLSYDEFMARPARLFALIDNDGDGGLTLEEARSFTRGIE